MRTSNKAAQFKLNNANAFAAIEAENAKLAARKAAKAQATTEGTSALELFSDLESLMADLNVGAQVATVKEAKALAAEIKARREAQAEIDRAEAHARAEAEEAQRVEAEKRLAYEAQAANHRRQAWAAHMAATVDARHAAIEAVKAKLATIQSARADFVMGKDAARALLATGTASTHAIEAMKVELTRLAEVVKKAGDSAALEIELDSAQKELFLVPVDHDEYIIWTVRRGLAAMDVGANWVKAQWASLGIAPRLVKEGFDDPREQAQDFRAGIVAAEERIAKMADRIAQGGATGAIAEAQKASTQRWIGYAEAMIRDLERLERQMVEAGILASVEGEKAEVPCTAKAPMRDAAILAIAEAQAAEVARKAAVAAEIKNRDAMPWFRGEVAPGGGTSKKSRAAQRAHARSGK